LALLACQADVAAVDYHHDIYSVSPLKAEGSILRCCPPLIYGGRSRLAVFGVTTVDEIQEISAYFVMGAVM
jgi:hypothetical protein